MKDLGYLKDDFLLEETQPGGKVPLLTDVLVDADALVALTKEDDSNHQKAVDISRRFHKKGAMFCLSPFTVAEAVTVFSYKVSHSAAIKLLKELRSLDLPVFSLPEKIQEELTDQWFTKQRAKGISYFDCYNMALMERYKNQMEAIFSFDDIYKKNGFETCANLLENVGKG